MNPKTCSYCKKSPVVFSTSLSVKGCSMKAYVVECDNVEDESALPFIEHRLSVYGGTKEEAIQRWNEVTPAIKD